MGRLLPRPNPTDLLTKGLLAAVLPRRGGILPAGRGASSSPAQHGGAVPAVGTRDGGPLPVVSGGEDTAAHKEMEGWGEGEGSPRCESFASRVGRSRLSEITSPGPHTE